MFYEYIVCSAKLYFLHYQPPILDDVDNFTYLGSIVDKQGGNIWGSTNLTLNTKIRIFNTTVKPVLLYGSETWRTTVTTTKKIQTFINTCLKRILRIRWPVIISNHDLWERTKQQPVGVDILQTRWRWIVHTRRRPVSSTTRRALTWNPKESEREVVHITPGDET